MAENFPKISEAWEDVHATYPGIGSAPEAGAMFAKTAGMSGITSAPSADIGANIQRNDIA